MPVHIKKTGNRYQVRTPDHAYSAIKKKVQVKLTRAARHESAQRVVATLLEADA